MHPAFQVCGWPAPVLSADGFCCRDAVTPSLSHPLHCHCGHHLLQTQGHSRGNRTGLMFSRAPMGALTWLIALLSVTQLPPTWVSPARAELPGSGGAGGSQAPCHRLPSQPEVLLQPQGECRFAQIPDSLAPSFPDSRLDLCRSWAWARAAQPWRAAAGTAACLASDCIAAALACCQPLRFQNQKYVTLQKVILPKSHAVWSPGAGSRDGITWQPAVEMLLFPLL